MVALISQFPTYWIGLDSILPHENLQVGGRDNDTHITPWECANEAVSMAAR